MTKSYHNTEIIDFDNVSGMSTRPFISLVGNFSRQSRLLCRFNMASKNQKHDMSDMASFRKVLASSRHLVILTGAGVSAESGVPTFRGAGGFWRTYQAQDLASPEAFKHNPSLVWEFYHYRREVMGSKSPNPAHTAIAEIEDRFRGQGREVAVITQNIDGLHKRAGSSNIIELHGNLFKTQCTRCGDISVNTDSPICEALRDRGAPDPEANSARIPVSELPMCHKEGCGGLLRPHVVWFGETLDSDVLDTAHGHLEKCDLCLVVGTSSIVYPAAMFAPQVT